MMYLGYIFAVIMAVIGIIYYINTKYKYNISFKTSMQLTDYPILILKSNDVQLNFLVDTGSSFSQIDSNALEGCCYEILKNNGFRYSTGAGSAKIEAGVLAINLDLENHNLNTYMAFKDMSDVFKPIKDKNGVNINGILGTDFLNANKFVIDFEKYLIRSKKLI